MTSALTALAVLTLLPAAGPADAPAPPTAAQLVRRLKDDSPGRAAWRPRRRD